LTLGALAARLNISVRQLERLFKESTGQSPQAYARGVRLRMAAWMLSHSRKSVAAIAVSCGFADASHFGREFRAAFGMPPGTWRVRAQFSPVLLEGAPDAVSEIFPLRQEFY